MEFKSPKKKKISFTDQPQRIIQPTKKVLKWFEEDEEWKDLRSSVDNAQTGKRPKKGLRKLFSKSENPFDDSVKPEVSRPKKQLGVKLKVFMRFIQKNKIAVAVVCFVVVVGIFVLSKFVLNDNSKDIAGTSVTAPKSGADLPREKPSFKILYPGTKNDETVGEIVKVSPDGSAAAYTYIDRIGDIQINITQQELPPNFKINQDGELAKLAESFQQRDIIQVDSVRVYHGSSSSGVQSLVFIKGNLLITVRASQKVSDDVWAAYISALHS
jgi:hypothetical protein